MAFDFPNSPTDGQIYAPPGGPVYVWQGGVWQASGDADDVAAAGSYDTVAALTAANVPANMKRIATLGYYAAGDGGGTTYVRNSSAAVYQTSNGGTVRWQVADRFTHNVRHYGAIGDGTTSDQAAFDAAWAEVMASHGTFYVPSVLIRGVIAAGNPAPVTISANDLGKFFVGQAVYVSGATGAFAVANNYHFIAAIAGNVITLASVNTSAASGTQAVNVRSDRGYVASINANDVVGVTLRGDGMSSSVWNNLHGSGISTLRITGTSSGSSYNVKIEGISFRAYDGAVALYIHNNIDIVMRSLEIQSAAVIEGSVFTCIDCVFYGNTTLPGLRLGHDGSVSTLTGTGQGQFIGGSFINQVSTTDIPALQIIGSVFGVSFIGCGFSAGGSSRTVSIDGPSAGSGLNRYWSDVSFYDCHGESTHNSLNNGADFIIGETNSFGQVAFRGGQFFGHGNSTNYRQDLVRVHRCKNLIIDGTAGTKLLAANGYSRALVRVEAGWPAAGDQWEFVNLTGLESIPILSDGNTPALFTGYAASKGVAGKTGIVADSQDLVSTAAGATANPVLSLLRNKIAAVNDIIGELHFDMLSSLGTRRTAFRITPLVNDPVDATEDVTVYLVTKVAGADVIQATITATGFLFPTLRYGNHIQLPLPVTKTASFTLAATENHVIVNMAGTCTVTLPSGLGTSRELWIKNIGAGTVVSASANIKPLAGGSDGTAILPAGPGKWALLAIVSTTWEIMASN